MVKFKGESRVKSYSVPGCAPRTTVDLEEFFAETVDGGEPERRTVGMTPGNVQAVLDAWAHSDETEEAPVVPDAFNRGVPSWAFGGCY